MLIFEKFNANNWLQHDEATQGSRLKLGSESPPGFFKIPLLIVASQLSLVVMPRNDSD